MAYAELSAVPDRIDVTTRYEEREQIKAVPGSRYDGERKLWTVPLSWPACLQLRGIFKNELHLGEQLIQWASHERNTRVDPLIKYRVLLEPTFRLDDRLYPFQEAGGDFMVGGVQVLLGDEMGTGKTIQCLNALSRDESLPALVICPNSTKTNWEHETKLWFPEANPYVVTGSLTEKRKILKRAAADPRALVIINIEAVRSFSRLAGYGSIHLVKCQACDRPKMDSHPETEQSASRCEVHPKELNSIPFKTVVFDEAHRMKDPKSKQTRAAWAVGHQDGVRYRYALTGTPIANDPSDLWSILHFLAPKEHPTRTKFIDRYCLQAFNAYGGLSVVGVLPETREEFQQVIGPRFRRVTKAEVLTQLPAKVRQLVEVELSPKQLKAYVEMEKNLATRVDGGVVVAASNLTAQVRLLQFASAPCEVDESGEVRMYERAANTSPKVDALMDIIDAARGKPLVATAMHKQLINLAARRLDREKIPYGLITGDVDEWTRRKNLEDFQNGKLAVLLFTIAAGGTGLNMTAADTIVFMQRSWSMVENRQAEDRVHRIGSEVHESINIIDLVARGTVEERVMQKYLEKVRQLDMITQDRARARVNGHTATDLDELEAFIMASHLGDV